MHSVTLTPDAAGSLVVTITYDAKGTSGSDWGASYQSRAFCTQSGSTTYGEQQPMANTRGSQTVRAVFAVTSGAACEVGLYGTISGAVQGDWWNVHITAELIKL